MLREIVEKTNKSIIKLPEDDDGVLELLSVEGDYVIARKDMQDGIKIDPYITSGDFVGTDDNGKQVSFSMSKGTWKKVKSFFEEG